MHGNSNAGQAAGVEPELAAMPLDNLAHMDNNLLPNHSNTRIGWMAEIGAGPEQSFAAPPPPEGLLRLEAGKDRDMGKPEQGRNTICRQQATTTPAVLHACRGTSGLLAIYQHHARQTCEFHDLANVLLPGARQEQARKSSTRHQPLFRKQSFSSYLPLAKGYYLITVNEQLSSQNMILPIITDSTTLPLATRKPRIPMSLQKTTDINTPQML
jgi:hypothetical protein